MIIKYLKNGEFIDYNNEKLDKNTKIKFICSVCNKTKTSFYRSYTGSCGYCKRKKSMLINHGVENPFQLDYVKEKIKQTNLKRYGVENPGQIEDNKINREIKRTQTNLKRYGVENTLQLDTIKEKIKQTNIKKYGGNSPMNSEKILHKMYKTNIQKYGTKVPSMNNKIKEKAKKQIKKTLQQRGNNKKINFYNNKIINIKNFTPLFNVNEYIGSDNINKYTWKCNRCNISFRSTLYSGNRPECPVCDKKLINKYSKPENELNNFIKLLGINTIQNSRSIISPLELDIYIPSHNLAIEFDGLYWHSDIYKNKNYHLNKTLECNKQGIQLIHIFENEWINKQDIVKARLKNLLGLNTNRIGARKTTIREIEAKEKNIFLNTYHLQGEDRSAIKLGAFYNEELIGVMTFSKPRIFMGQKYKEGKWELSRFATIADTYTPGLASKMLKYFENNWEWVEIYSYADRRWSMGGLYSRIGFELEYETKPNYWYWDGKQLKHRYNYRKSNLKKFENYDENKTEFEIMDEAGYCRIWDCGNYKFIKKT